MYSFVTSSFGSSFIQSVIQKCSLSVYSGSVILYNHIIQICFGGPSAETMVGNRISPLKELYEPSGEEGGGMTHTSCNIK